MSVTRYHFNKKTGKPGICHAEYKCPLGIPLDEHYNTRYAAQKAAEKVLESENGNFSTNLTKKSTQDPKEFVKNLKVHDLESTLDIDGHLVNDIPAGRYFIGDPAYVIGKMDESNKLWSDYCDNATDLGANIGDYPVISIQTEYGDGVYESSNGNSYPVDSGTIGIVPVELLEKAGVPEKEYEKLGKIKDFNRDFFVEDKDKGIIDINGEYIYTGDYTIEDLEDDDSYEDDWDDDYDITNEIFDDPDYNEDER